MRILDKLFGRSEPVKPPILQMLAKPPEQLAGKAMADLAEPGWEVVSGGGSWQYAGSVWESYSDEDSEKAYRSHALIMACVRRITDSICEAPLQIVGGVGKTEEVIENHPTLDLIRRPNAFYSRNDLLKYWAMRVLLTARGYIWKWRTKGGRVGELWPVPTSWVRERGGKGNQLITAYSVSQGGQPAIVKVEDMVRMVLCDPSTMAGGVSPLQAAQHDYQLDLKRENYLVEMLTNSHVPGLKFKFDRKLSPKEKQELRAAAGDRVGEGKRGSPLIMDFGGDVELMEPLKDMDWPGLTDLTEARICSAFGVPPVLVQARIGIKSGSQYANYETARRSFYAETLMPLWGSLADSLTLGLLHAEGDERLRFEFDLSKIQALQEAADVKSTRVRADWQAGLIKRNEAREAQGWDPLDDDKGEMFYTPVGATISADAETAKPEPKPFPSQFALPPLDEEEVNAEAE